MLQGDMTMNRKGIVVLSVLLACTVLASFSMIKHYQARNLERSIDELPIIIAHKSDGSMHFTCLNREKCIPPIERFGWLSSCGLGIPAEPLFRSVGLARNLISIASLVLVISFT